jgi:8-oxo-dGTP pyrophosphatase MutT (NUDIX family)
MSQKKTYSGPITSYGLILYTFTYVGKRIKIKYVVYQRRDTFEYIEFLKGTWSSENALPSLFSLMTFEERERLRNYTFDELWDDLWVTKNHRLYFDTKRKGENRYRKVKDDIPFLLDSTETYVTEAPWGFPKGKKSYFHENEKSAAIREFSEETRLSIDNIVFQNDIHPFVENFKGTNGRYYCTHYYVGYSPEEHQITKIPVEKGIRKECVSDEANDARWVTLDEARDLIHPRRFMILRQLEEILLRQHST